MKKKLAAQDALPEEKKKICEKCGSVMHKRLLAVNQSQSQLHDYVNIFQCNVCRFYIEDKQTNQTFKPEESVPESDKTILEKAYELGIKYEKQCTGCAQTTIAAMFEALKLWDDDVFKAASGLANGLGLTGDGTCASLLGASMVISYLFGREYKDFKDLYIPMKSYALVKKLHNLFLREYSTCRCSDVQKGLIGISWNYWELNGKDDNYRAKMVEVCSKLVGNIAKIATKIILENGYNPRSKEK